MPRKANGRADKTERASDNGMPGGATPTGGGQSANGTAGREPTEVDDLDRPGDERIPRSWRLRDERRRQPAWAAEVTTGTSRSPPAANVA